MLVTFSVQNYRSFAARQTISMVASVGAKRKEEHSFPSENSVAPNLLRSACLFGPNASGKSSFVRALGFYREFIISSAKDFQEGEKIAVTPFKLDRQWREKPSEFEAVFIHKGVLFQYGFAVDANRIWSEWLFSRPNEPDTKTRMLFQREYDPENETYCWNISKKNVRGEKELWKKSTRDNALFLSTAIQLKSIAFKTIFDCIRATLRIIASPDRLLPNSTIRQYLKDGWDDKILNFLHAVDIRIVDMEIEEKETLGEIIDTNTSTERQLDKVRQKNDGVRFVHITSFHRDTNGELVGLNFKDESDGSRVVFSLAGPWLDALENGYTLVVDELHGSLHPHAFKFLVNLFHDPKINKNNAQLIFTSHDTSVMTKGFMHQDQVWLLEKGDAENSLLFPLSDYKVRDISAFQKAYFDGRYGAVPQLRELASE